MFEPWPDMDAKLVVVGDIANGFAMPLFGKKLTNVVIATLPGTSLGVKCAGLALFARQPNTFFVDDGQLTKHCHRACALTREDGYCSAWRVTPPG